WNHEEVSQPLDRQALVSALRAVEGVADADVDPDAEGGLGTLRLDLEPGCDERAVATQVSRLLRERFGLGVDADRVSVAENPVELVEIADDLPDDSQAVAEPPPVESAFS